MPCVTVGRENSANIDLHYEDMGSGPPVVLIHGYPLSGASWEKQVPALLESGHRVITYDRRGFGRSSHPTTGYSFDVFADDLHKLIASLHLQDYTLVGFSMGGGEIVRHLAKFGSNGTSRAVIISGVPPFLKKTSDNPEGVDASVFQEIEQNLVKDRYAYFTEFFNNFFNTDKLLGSRVTADVARAFWNVAVQSSPIASLASVATWQEDFRPDLEKIEVPTLVLHGDEDRIVPLDASAARTAQLIKGARLEVIRGGPHCITWTHADLVNELLLSFLAEPAMAGV